jgi:broad specificity phosphatase PhoE
MMLKFVLLRHGYSMGNKNKTLSGWEDVVLTKEGIQDLQVLQKAYDYPKTDLYCSSDLSRAYDTARILFPQEEIQTYSDFREIHFGILEGSSFYDINHDAFFDDWLAGGDIEEGENYEAFKRRILGGLASLGESLQAKDQKSATLVCHSGVIRVLHALCRQTKPEDIFALACPNGLGFELFAEIKDGRVALAEVRALDMPKDLDVRSGSR